MFWYTKYLVIEFGGLRFDVIINYKNFTPITDINDL